MSKRGLRRNGARADQIVSQLATYDRALSTMWQDADRGRWGDVTRIFGEKEKLFADADFPMEQWPTLYRGKQMESWVFAGGMGLLTNPVLELSALANPDVMLWSKRVAFLDGFAQSESAAKFLSGTAPRVLDTAFHREIVGYYAKKGDPKNVAVSAGIFGASFGLAERSLERAGVKIQADPRLVSLFWQTQADDDFVANMLYNYASLEPSFVKARRLGK